MDRPRPPGRTGASTLAQPSRNRLARLPHRRAHRRVLGARRDCARRAGHIESGVGPAEQSVEIALDADIGRRADGGADRQTVDEGSGIGEGMPQASAASNASSGSTPGRMATGASSSRPAQAAQGQEASSPRSVCTSRGPRDNPLIESDCHSSRAAWRSAALPSSGE